MGCAELSENDDGANLDTLPTHPQVVKLPHLVQGFYLQPRPRCGPFPASIPQLLAPAKCGIGSALHHVLVYRGVWLTTIIIIELTTHDD